MALRLRYDDTVLLFGVDFNSQPYGIGHALRLENPSVFFFQLHQIKVVGIGKQRSLHRLEEQETAR